MPIKRINTPTPSRDWLDQDGHLLYGKHKGESVHSLARTNPSYLQWLIDEVENMNEYDRQIISQLLARQ